MNNMHIRPFQESDWGEVHKIVIDAFSGGDTYVYSPDTTEDEAYRIWIDTPTQTYVTVDSQNSLTGTYFIKPNQPLLGSHICNCGYITAKKFRGHGIARSMCIHSLDEAKKMGFKGMQFNAVVSTNTIAIELWKSLGFVQIGVVPNGFDHKKAGFVDTLIMFKVV